MSPRGRTGEGVPGPVPMRTDRGTFGRLSRRATAVGHRSRTFLRTSLIVAALVLFVLCLPDQASAKWIPSTSAHSERWPCRSFRDDFDDPSSLGLIEDWDGDASHGPRWLSQYRPHTVNIADGKMVLALEKADWLNGYNRTEGAQTFVSWTRWIKTGKVCSSMMTARGNGTVSAIVIMNFNHSVQIDDEIDIEFVGKDEGRFMQSNWFGEARPVYGNGITDHPVAPDTATNFHVYCMERTNEYISWTIDNFEVRRATFAEWGSRGLPWRESKIIFNIWDGGQGDWGTGQWAGSPTDWTDAQNPNYRVVIDWVQVWCYGNEDPEPTNGTWTTRTTTRTATTRRSQPTPTSTSRTKSRTRTTLTGSSRTTERTLLGGFRAVTPLTRSIRTTTAAFVPVEVETAASTSLAPTTLTLTTGLPGAGNTLVTVTPTADQPANVVATTQPADRPRSGGSGALPKSAWLLAVGVLVALFL
ncbi:concanavalin A-like lectin/glucanase domain-containing protein [Hyaloraphidium curvatum]|nr:concanavalin A-like lectin/glucanase domain-containing protein [Hyaloraphidium curvatum]